MQEQFTLTKVQELEFGILQFIKKCVMRIKFVII